MSSRQEEKELRKKERLERERAAAAAAKRKRLLGIVGGLALAAVIAAAIVFAVSKGGDDRADDAKLRQVAAAGGCEYKSLPNEGETHLESDQDTFDKYKSNPPTSGTHRPTPAQDGRYAPGNEPDPESWVHTLEHGRILLQYKPGSPKPMLDALTRLYNEPVLDSDPQYHMVLMQNNSEMPFAVAAVAWRHFMGCKDASAKAIEAMREFRDARVDRAPEFFP